MNHAEKDITNKTVYGDIVFLSEKYMVSVKYLWENKIAKEGHPLLQ